MSRRRRPSLHAEARRVLAEAMRREGAKVRRARRRRRWTQADLATRVGISQSTVSKIELGQGGSLSVEAWQRIALVWELPLNIELGRDSKEEPRDAGHLAMQELVLRLGRQAGYLRTFELATRPADPALSIDVGLRDDRRRRLVRIECVNTFGDIGGSMRSSDRKGAEAEAYLVATGHGEAYSVHLCWVVRSTRRNREIVARYPELFASRFPGSSGGWVQALSTGSPPPVEPGFVWCDATAGRPFAWRPRRSVGG